MIHIDADEIVAKAAELYVESPEAQHGDAEEAGWDAGLWWNLFAEAREELEEQIKNGGDDE